jgi:methanogenic corrinoid protein MtbC1
MSTQFHNQASQTIGAQRDCIAEAMVCHQLMQQRESSGFVARGRAECLRDAKNHLDNLAESLSVAQPLLFADYVVWLRVMLAGRDITTEDMVKSLQCLIDALRQTVDSQTADLAIEYISQGLAHLETAPDTPPTFLIKDQPLSFLAHEYLTALLTGDRQRASRMIMEAVEGGVAVQDVYLQVFQTCQYEIGRLWQTNQISVAQEHYGTAATQLIMSQLYPYLFSGKRTGRTLVATCTAGDLHEIGVRMVSDLFELNGWDTFYLGANTPLPDVLQTVRDNRADVLAISATLTPHLEAVEELIRQMHASPDCSKVKILVGGYPFNVVPGMWRQVGADGCAHDAVGSVELANRLVLEGDSL